MNPGLIEIALVLASACYAAFRVTHLAHGREPKFWAGCTAEDDYYLSEECWMDIEEDGDQQAPCTWCDGDGLETCWAPYECCDPYCDGEIHRCRCCAGTGLRVFQVVF